MGSVNTSLKDRNQILEDNKSDYIFSDAIKSVQEELDRISKIVQSKVDDNSKKNINIHNIVHDKLLSVLAIIVTILLSVGSAYYHLTITSEKRLTDIEYIIKQGVEKRKEYDESINRQKKINRENNIENERQHNVILDKLYDNNQIQSSKIKSLEEENIRIKTLIEDLDYKYSHSISILRNEVNSKVNKTGTGKPTQRGGSNVPKEENPNP